MTLAYTEVTVTLELITPLHIGTGLVENFKVKVKDKEINSQYATIVRCSEGNPVLPASSIKGALRDALAGDDLLVEMFGEAHHGDKGTGKAGVCLVGHGFFTEFADGTIDDISAPYWGKNKYTYIETRIKVNEGLGTAEDKHLFNEEMVPPGAMFKVKFRIPLDVADSKDMIEPIINTLKKQGMQLGGGSSYGRGQLRLINENKIHHETKSFSGGKEIETDRGVWTFELEKSSQTQKNISLHCKGPFLVADPASEDIEEGVLQTVAFQLVKGEPYIGGSSLKGALRARARWLFGDEKFTTVDTDIPKGLDLADVLFGATGWKSLVTISGITLSGAKVKTVTSVGLDRFSAAPIDGALFNTLLFYGGNLSFSLTLDDRGLTLSKEDKESFDTLVKDVQDNGLVLGMGGNKGFGWFEKEVKSDE